MEISPTDALRLFLIDKEDAGVRATTIGYYRYACTRFIDEVDLPPTIGQVSSVHLRTWTAAMRARGLKPSAIHSYQGAVWTWLRWLYQQDEFGVGDITRRVKLIQLREEDYTRRTISLATKKKLLVVARARVENPRRNAAIIETLWSTGARRSELAACLLSHYNASAGTLRLQHTKMGVPRVVAIESSARTALDAYIIRERGPKPGALFLGRGGAPLSSDGIKNLLRSLALGIGSPVSAHDFRRAAAARWLRAGAPVDVVMSQLGHTDSSMTLMYGAEGREERAIGIIHDLDAGVRTIWGKRSG